jgi:hypothetical protein
VSSNNDVRQLFDTVLAAPPPDTTDVGAAIRIGRRQQHRRTAAVALSAAAVLAVAGIAATHVVPGLRHPAVSAAASGTVTAVSQLRGTWQALELDGRDVHAAHDSGGQPLQVRFSAGTKEWMWGANDDVNWHSGTFSVSAQGRFEAHEVSVTLAGRIGGPKYLQNPDAVSQANKARIAPATSAAPAKLFLLADDRVLGVYAKAADK